MGLVDITVRAEGMPEVNVEPDGTVELVFSQEGSSVTLLMTLDQARVLREEWYRSGVRELIGEYRPR